MLCRKLGEILVDQLLTEKKNIFEEFLTGYLAEHASGIRQPAAYSLQAGGKRIRPILSMLAAEALYGDQTQALPVGLAIEMIHTFSLIHDDLPAIDNDDLRRGRPTCHKQFGEAAAILAGDSLIFDAFNLVATYNYAAATKGDLLAALSRAGHLLIQGEYDDILSEGSAPTEETIRSIYLNKTARLFELSLYAGGRTATDNAKHLAALSECGLKLGLAFQAIDDILDVTADAATLGKTAGKDLLQDKATLVKIMDLEQTRAWANQITEEAVQAIDDLPHPQIIQDLARTMLKRIM